MLELIIWLYGLILDCQSRRYMSSRSEYIAMGRANPD